MSSTSTAEINKLADGKFRHPTITAKGEKRAAVALSALRTLWFNTGTLCNLTCANCYIESSPTNDALVYLTLDDVRAYLDEIAALGLPTEEIGFTGGEPFMNPAFAEMVELSLERGFSVLILTNAMRPMMKCAERIRGWGARYGERLTVRVSIDHYSKALHETERGPRTWEPTINGLCWLVENSFTVHVAGRLKWAEPEAAERAGFARLFAELGVDIDAKSPHSLVLFPEMDAEADVPEITEACWDILGVNPEAMMCAGSRMVVRRKGVDSPAVLSCTLLAYDPQFELGATLAESMQPVALNHPHCARFCVLGGASCSA